MTSDRMVGIEDREGGSMDKFRDNVELLLVEGYNNASVGRYLTADLFPHLR